uniref:Rapamycin-insensitive companion of mTOR N-terminal domain-containing protein n=1 Tax=Astyanax mexicanus TaxID=7994 RepID=A0A8B9GX69_ASTMX
TGQTGRHRSLNVVSFSPEPSENMREILQNVSKSHGVSNMRKLGHLNNFIKVLSEIGGEYRVYKQVENNRPDSVVLRGSVKAECKGSKVDLELERGERVEIIAVDAALFPGSVTNSLVAVGNDGLHEGDRMVLACNAIICELALRNPEVVAGRGGLSTLLKNVLDSQQSRINEALITTVLHLLNHPHTRQYVLSTLQIIFSDSYPYLIIWQIFFMCLVL